MPSPGNQFLSDEFGDIEDYFVSDHQLIDQYIGDQLWTWGAGGLSGGNFGQTGDNSSFGRTTPVTTLLGGTNWKSVSCGVLNVAAIKTDGTLWVWGINTYNQLAVNDLITRSTPVTTFAGGTNWKSVACGRSHMAAIKTDGTLWAWGRNFYGALGINDTITRSTPVTTFTGGTNWKSVSCGGYFTSAIKTDGTLWVWGENTQGTLGINSSGVSATHRSIPVTTIAGGNNWKQVACGYRNVTAIKTDGTLWTWGNRVATNDAINRSTPVTTFAGGTNWKFASPLGALKTDGTLWVWGENSGGKLGTNDTIFKTTPVTTFAGGTNWKSISSSLEGIAAIKTDGTLWVWGRNGEAQLGINDIIWRSTPVTTFAGGTRWKQVAAGSYHAAVLTAGFNVNLL